MTTQALFSIVADELEAAKKKHPEFADTVSNWTVTNIKESLKEWREAQRHLPTSQHEVLMEEVNEAFEATLEGRHEDALREWAQVAAVAIRCMEAVVAKMKGGAE